MIFNKKSWLSFTKTIIAMCNFNYETKIDGRYLQKKMCMILLHLQSFMPVLQYQLMTV